jgi:uncharacterized protein YndB with AHSA1/START domain
MSNENSKTQPITVQNITNAPVEKVWAMWTEPKHITEWCQASDDWHAPYAENDLVTGGKFKTTMAAKDGSVSFDFEGVYSNVNPLKAIEYNMSDGRHVSILFTSEGDSTKIVETFEPETENPIEMQKGGWQAILDNFKNYVESN